MDPSPSPPDPDMALVVAPSVPPVSALVAASTAATRRYRPSPAKTFQCRGYGECRMVFSRSEHLARHIRKHTGERPFTCHCSKQFSRLDNLRQHAQTVHADKHDDNERMMRDLTSLHATMSAANKLAPRAASSRKPATQPPAPATGGDSASRPLVHIKQEDMAHQRPDTSTGYESGEAMYPATGSSFRDQSHSFRDPGQSFLAPPPSPSPGAAPAAHAQSFRAHSRAHLQVADLPDPTRPSSRPPTTSGPADPHPRSLPPLAAVVSASLASPQTPSPGPHTPASQQQHQQHQQQSLLPFPASLGHYRQSSITHRPGTAPASASLFARSSFPDRSRLGSSSGRPDLSLLHSGFAGRAPTFVDHFHQQFSLGEPSDLSNSQGNDPSPFFFNPPVPAAATPPVSNISRKRPFGGPDGPSDDPHQLRPDRPASSAGPFGELNYEYGSESRPQSRRLTVMELCNDDDNSQPRPPSQRRGEQQQQQQQQSSPFLLSTAPASATPPHPPTTASGLVSSTSTLRLFDRSTSPGSTQQPTNVFSRTPYAAAGAAGDGSAGGRGAKEGGRGGSYGVLSSDFPTPTTTFPNRTASPSYTPPAVLSTSTSASDAFSYGEWQQRQHQQQYPKQQPHHSPQYFPQSPAFSTASNDSSPCSPRSPLSDISSSSAGCGGSPYPAYAHSSSSTRTAAAAAASSVAVYAHSSSANAHTSSGISAQSHHLHHPRQRHHQQQQQHQHQQHRDAQVRASVSPHPGFGMRV